MLVQLAIALGPVLYTWEPRTGDANALHEFEEDQCITALKWNAAGNLLAVGMPDATVLIFDVEKRKQVRIMRGHTNRVSSLSWSSATLTSAGASGAIMNSDVREKKHVMSMMEYHSKEVCGLAWSREHDYLASGGADHLVALWDHRYASCAALWTVLGHSNSGTARVMHPTNTMQIPKKGKLNRSYSNLSSSCTALVKKRGSDSRNVSPASTEEEAHRDCWVCYIESWILGSHNPRWLHD
jgi:YD repeat-containing protein